MYQYLYGLLKTASDVQSQLAFRQRVRLLLQFP